MVGRNNCITVLEIPPRQLSPLLGKGYGKVFSGTSLTESQPTQPMTLGGRRWETLTVLCR